MVGGESLNYRYKKGDAFVLDVVGQVPKQSNLPDEEPVYYTSAGVSLAESDLEKLSPYNEFKPSSTNNFVLVRVNKEKVDDITRLFYKTWLEAYNSMVAGVLADSDINTVESEFKSGAIVIAQYSAVNKTKNTEYFIIDIT